MVQTIDNSEIYGADITLYMYTIRRNMDMLFPLYNYFEVMFILIISLTNNLQRHEGYNSTCYYAFMSNFILLIIIIYIIILRKT